MTTFAPVSHDADHHDLPNHALTASNGDDSHDAPVNSFTSHQNGVVNGDAAHPPADAETAPQVNDKTSVDTLLKPTSETPAASNPLETSAQNASEPSSTEATANETNIGSIQPSIERDPSAVQNAPLAAPAATAEGLKRNDTPNEQVLLKEEQAVTGAPTVMEKSDIDVPVGAGQEPQDQEMIDSAHKEQQDQDMTDVSGSAPKATREREEDDDNEEPSAKRARTEDAKPAEPTIPSSAEPFAAAQAQPVEATTAAPAQVPEGGAATASTANAAPVPAPASADVQPWVVPALASYGSLTDIQKKRLLEGMRNLKKSKHAFAFAKPVDPVALNLPNYSNLVPNPMDLSTMEQKLRDDQYDSVNAYVDDFNLMVQNAINFNTQTHPVAQAGMVLRSQLQAQLSKLPKAGEQPPPPQSKKAAREAAPTIPRETTRRAARPSLNTANSNHSPVAPLDGTPIIRRGSNLDDRPKRKIQKPAPRDLSYAKTPKKRYQGELKFANEVLTEVTRPRYNDIAGPFLQPVDPVALNIPQYFKIIKKPMDVSTIKNKLAAHQYENLKEFESDFRQIFTNCFKFNQPATAVHQMGKAYEEVFNSEMKKKDDRLAILAPSSAAQSPAVDSDEEEEEDEEDNEEAERMAKLRALNEQVAAIQQQAQELMSGNWAKPKKDKGKGGKGAGGKSRKSGGGASASAPARAEKKTTKAKAQPKKQKPLTSSQKQEIAERIGELPTEEINRVADQIKASLRRAGKPVPPDDEMEFQIDDIPDELLHELLVKVRKHGPTQAKDQDDDYASPPAPARGHKGKKNKPMTKSEQEAQINRLEGQLKTFQGAPGEELFGEGAKDDDDDSSEDDSGSESEEE